jgi:hypothetical protein
MVIFSECPQCKGSHTVKINKDISLVERKTKFKREVVCNTEGCGAMYLISVRIKARLIIPDSEAVEETGDDNGNDA